jgi:hypothetical protein
MRLQHNLVLFQGAPAARKSIPGFDKVNGAFIFGAPHPLRDFAPRFIDLNKRSRQQQGIHREILHPDVPVRVSGFRELLQIDERDRAPLVDHAAEIGGTPDIESRVHSNRDPDLGCTDGGVQEMGFRRVENAQIIGGLGQVNSVP